MPTVSVKLPEDTKQRIQSIAQSQGITAHALMVNAIESALAKVEHQNVLVGTALRAREQVLESGTVLDGKAFGTYLKARVRGQNARRPRPIALISVFSNSR